MIKALLSLHHKELVPTVHYEKANPKLDLGFVMAHFF